MTQFSGSTVWQVMQGRTRDRFLASAILPCIIAFFYGCYKLYELGKSAEHFAYSYIPLIGSIIAWLGIMGFSLSDIRNARLALIPARVFALYIFCILGGIGIASSTWPAFSLLGFVKGAIWTFLGWRMFRRLGMAADLSRTPIDLPDLKAHLVSHVELPHYDLQKLALDESVAARLRA